MLHGTKDVERLEREGVSLGPSLGAGIGAILGYKIVAHFVSTGFYGKTLALGGAIVGLAVNAVWWGYIEAYYRLRLSDVVHRILVVFLLALYIGLLVALVNYGVLSW